MLQILACESELESVLRLRLPTTIYYDECDPNNTIVRWGRSCRRESFPKVVNKGPAIRLCVNKPLSIQKLSDAGLRVPKLFTAIVPPQTKAVIRPIKHANGDDFLIVDGPYNIPDGHFGKEFIETNMEWRIWFFRDNLLGCKRVPMEGQSGVCRNRWGYSFHYSPSFWLKRQVKKAARTLGMDFGAADVLEKDGKFYFLELNSAPSMDHAVVRRFFLQQLNSLEN